MRKRPLFLFACVFLIGLVFQRYQAIEIMGVFLIILSTEVYWGIRYKSIKRMAGRSIVLLSAFILGAFHMYSEMEFRNAYLSKLEDGDLVTVWGESSKIEHTEYGIRMYLTDCYVSVEEEVTPCNDVMVYTSSTYFHVGEIQKISGQLNMFDQAKNQGNFDSQVYYHSQKIDFAINAERIEVLGFKKSFLRDGLLKLKESVQSVYVNCTDAKTAGFLSAMILGDKSDLDAALKSLFTTGGIAHILAISGLHVSILGRGGYKLLRKRRIGFLCAGMIASMIVLCYSYMVGNGMSAQRAVGMLLIFFMGQIVGRSYDMLNALGAVCLYLLWDNPFLLEYSGFWFSIMALVGIGFVSDIFSWKTKFTSGLWGGLGITLAIMPVTALCYYDIPLYSVVVNAIVLSLLSPVFCIALIGGVVGLLSPAIASILLMPCQWALTFFEAICAFVEKLPGASLLTGMPSKNRVIFYYGVLLIGIGVLRFFKRKWETNEKKELPKYWTILKLVLGMICIIVLIFPKSHEFEISFLDVGQGDGIYLCMSDGTRMFIDGGSSDVSQVGENRILPFLKSKQVGQIDYWFVTHADTDHISGLLEILESGYTVENLVVAEAAPREPNFLELVETAQRAGTHVIYMSTGDGLLEDGWNVQCLYPGTDEIVDKNESSLVLVLKTEEISALFSGDISTEIENQLVKNGVLENVTLYKVAHHGSKYSNSLELLEQIDAEFAVISCAKDNSYGHPNAECLERLENVGCEIWITSKCGQVTIEVGTEIDSELEVQGWLVHEEK